MFCILKKGSWFTNSRQNDRPVRLKKSFRQLLTITTENDEGEPGEKRVAECKDVDAHVVKFNIDDDSNSGTTFESNLARKDMQKNPKSFKISVKLDNVTQIFRLHPDRIILT